MSRLLQFPILLLSLALLPHRGGCQEEEGNVAFALGGWSSANTSEVFSLGLGGVSCTLPPLPVPMSGHTVDVVDGKLVACMEYLCYQLAGDAWVFLGGVLFARSGHTSSVTDQGLLLVGGWSNPYNLAAYNAEVMPSAGGVSNYAFPVPWPGRRDHCSIQVSPSTIVMTGGLDTEDLVTEVSGVGGALAFRNLSSLSTGRWDHACGSYIVGEAMMLIVTGGGNEHPLASTEVLEYPSEQNWRSVAPLPSPRWGLRSVSLGGTFLVTGGGDATMETDEVVEWDPVAEEWTVALYMMSARGNHAVAEVPFELISSFCHAI